MRQRLSLASPSAPSPLETNKFGQPLQMACFPSVVHTELLNNSRKAKTEAKARTVQQWLAFGRPFGTLNAHANYETLDGEQVKIFFPPRLALETAMFKLT
nr:hypothetical protein CFP56_36086 [Quercus suber]POF09858.1 hypothetical protein CFP56_76667 [Quercus suber]